MQAVTTRQQNDNSRSSQPNRHLPSDQILNTVIAISCAADLAGEGAADLISASTIEDSSVQAGTYL